MIRFDAPDDSSDSDDDGGFTLPLTEHVRHHFDRCWPQWSHRGWQPVVVTTFACVFLRESRARASGKRRLPSRIVFFDPRTGFADLVADSLGDLATRLDDPDDVIRWFAPRLIRQLRQRGLRPRAHQCFALPINEFAGEELSGGDRYSVVELDAYWTFLSEVVRPAAHGTGRSPDELDSWLFDH